jgi:hypothetical protein
MCKNFRTEIASKNNDFVGVPLQWGHLIQERNVFYPTGKVTCGTTGAGDRREDVSNSHGITQGMDQGVYGLSDVQTVFEKGMWVLPAIISYKI